MVKLKGVSTTGLSFADDLWEPDAAAEERLGQVVKNDSIESPNDYNGADAGGQVDYDREERNGVEAFIVVFS